MPRLRARLTAVSEAFGLDWLLVLAGKSPFKDPPLYDTATIAQIRERFGDMRGGKKLDDAVAHCTALVKREEERSEAIESKAFTLTATAGIAASFIVAFGSLLLDRAKLDNTPLLWITAIFYILAVLALVLTVYVALRVVRVGDYVFAYPSPEDIFVLSTGTLADVKLERAASLYYSYVRNLAVVNRKASYLQGAQLWFRNSVVLLLVLAFTLATYALLRPSSPSAAPVAPIPAVTVTVQASAAPSITPQPLPTATPAAAPTTQPASSPAVSSASPAATAIAP